MRNLEIRERAKEKNVYLWQIAEYLGICEMTLTRKLRKELPETEKQTILSVIQTLSEGA